MAKRKDLTPLPVGRPTLYSDDVEARFIELYQQGKTFDEISNDPDMPSYRTLARWRATNVEFRQILDCLEEDRARRKRAEAETVIAKMRDDYDALRQGERLDHVAAAAFITQGYERTTKMPVLRDIPLQEVDVDDGVEKQRLGFASLHPVTQSKIKQILLEDLEMRGEEE